MLAAVIVTQGKPPPTAAGLPAGLPGSWQPACSSDPPVLWTPLQPPVHLVFTLEQPEPNPHSLRGPHQTAKNSPRSRAGEVQGKALQKMTNELLPHIPFHIYTVKGVEIVLALAEQGGRLSPYHLPTLERVHSSWPNPTGPQGRTGISTTGLKCYSKGLQLIL